MTINCEVLPGQQTVTTVTPGKE